MNLCYYPYKKRIKIQTKNKAQHKITITLLIRTHNIWNLTRDSRTSNINLSEYKLIRLRYITGFTGDQSSSGNTHNIKIYILYINIQYTTHAHFTCIQYALLPTNDSVCMCVSSSLMGPFACFIYSGLRAFPSFRIHSRNRSHEEKSVLLSLFLSL